MRPPLPWALRHFDVIRRGCFALCLLPALWLGALALVGQLGVNALERVLHGSGRAAQVLLLLTLAVTPLRRASVRIAQRLSLRFGRRVSDWNWLIRLRRQLGLFAFAYAGLHLLLYVGLDVGPHWDAVRDDAAERRFILLGTTALLLMLPLALTSTQAAMRALGRHWRRLHTLIYPAAVLVLLHIAAQAKVGQGGPWWDGAALALLLGARARAWQRGERQVAADVPPRAGR